MRKESQKRGLRRKKRTCHGSMGKSMKVISSAVCLEWRADVRCTQCACEKERRVVLHGELGDLKGPLRHRTILRLGCHGFLIYRGDLVKYRERGKEVVCEDSGVG